MSAAEKERFEALRKHAEYQRQRAETLAVEAAEAAELRVALEWIADAARGPRLPGTLQELLDKIGAEAERALSWRAAA